MADKSSIEWTDATWNPVRGCSMAKGSETGGCLNCYAARMAARNLPEMKSPTTGKPFARIMDSGPRWTGEVELIEKALDIPLHWKRPRRVFVNSMSDLFHERLSFSAIDQIFTVMVAAPQHTYQILTKRPERMSEYFSSGQHDHGHGPRRADYHLGQSIWLGVSVENQATADARIPLLLKTPADKRFVSYEPALGPVDFASWLLPRYPDARPEMREQYAKKWKALHPSIDWIIIGGESGPGARPFNIEWARKTLLQCVSRAACYVKQLGAHPYGVRHNPEFRVWPHSKEFFRDNSHVSTALSDKKGGRIEEWPEDLRVREYPEAA